MLRFFFALSFFLFEVSATHAQADTSKAFMFGPKLHYAFGAPLNLDRSPNVINLLGSNGQGTSNAHTFGGGVQAFLPSLFSDKLSLRLGGDYEWTRGAFTSNTYSEPYGDERFHLTSSYSDISIEGLLAYDLGSNWSLEVGPRVSYRISNSLVQWRESLSDIPYSNGATQDTIASGDGISSARLHIALPIGLTRTTRLSDNLTLCYGITGTLDWNSAVSGYFAEGVGIRASIGLLFPVAPHAVEEAAKAEPTKVNPPVATATPPLSAPIAPSLLQPSIHLEVNGVATRLAKVREVDTLIDRLSSIPSAVSQSKEVKDILHTHNIPLTLPYHTRELIRAYRVPDLSLSRAIESEAGVASWEVAVMQGERTIAHYSNADSSNDDLLDVSVSIASETKPLPIIATLTATDARGTIRSASDTLSIEMDRSHVPDTVREWIATFIGNPHPSSDASTLDYFIAALDTRGTLNIRPLTDAQDLSYWLLTHVKNASRIPRSIELLTEPIITDPSERSVLESEKVIGSQARFVLPEGVAKNFFNKSDEGPLRRH